MRPLDMGTTAFKARGLAAHCRREALMLHEGFLGGPECYLTYGA